MQGNRLFGPYLFLSAYHQVFDPNVKHHAFSQRRYHGLSLGPTVAIRQLSSRSSAIG